MKSIDVDYNVVRDGEVIFGGYSSVGITDKNVKEVAEFIRDNHTSGELVDVPSHIYDRIVAAVTKEAIKDLKSELKTPLYETDEVNLQEVLPIDLVNLLPEDVVDLIDIEKIQEYYASEEDTDESQEEEDLNDWTITEEEREEPTKENTLYLTIKQVYFDEIMSGEKTAEYREIKDTTYKKYLATNEDGSLPIDESVIFDEEGLDKYFIYAWNNGVFPFTPKNIQYLDLAVGYNKERDTARVEVTGYHFDPMKGRNGEIVRLSDDKDGNIVPDPEGDQTFWVIAFKLGKILECHRANK